MVRFEEYGKILKNPIQIFNRYKPHRSVFPATSCVVGALSNLQWIQPQMVQEAHGDLNYEEQSAGRQGGLRASFTVPLIDNA